MQLNTKSVLSISQRPASFPDQYGWYVLACALDLMLTFVAINTFGAIEVNSIAAAAINTAGFGGLIGLKVMTMLVVIVSCECIAVRRPPTARRLAEWAIVVAALPVILSLAQIAAFIPLG